MHLCLYKLHSSCAGCSGSCLHTMTVLSVVVLLSSALLLCNTAASLEQLTCGEDYRTVAGHLAMHHINKHHDHGYKFRLNEIQGDKMEKVDGGCHIDLQLHLLETNCPTIDPRNFEDCELREETERAVMANCTVMITVTDSDASVTKYECMTKQVKTNQEMMTICPDCPTLIPLNNPEGLKSIHEAVKEFNKNISNDHIYVLREVGRIQSGYVSSTGMNYYAEFSLVETPCPQQSRILHEACKPLCRDRAHHTFCQSSYSSANKLQSVRCEFYPPMNTTVLGHGEKEPICTPDDHIGLPAPPSHAGGQGHPPHTADQGHPPHTGGQGPPPGQERRHGPPFNLPPYVDPFHRCIRFLANSDPAIHPICPWPLPQPLPSPKLS